jgi:hypothetical protein
VALLVAALDAEYGFVEEDAAVVVVLEAEDW